MKRILITVGLVLCLFVPDMVSSQVEVDKSVCEKMEFTTKCEEYRYYALCEKVIIAVEKEEGVLQFDWEHKNSWKLKPGECTETNICVLTERINECGVIGQEIDWDNDGEADHLLYLRPVDVDAPEFKGVVFLPEYRTIDQQNDNDEDKIVPNIKTEGVL